MVIVAANKAKLIKKPKENKEKAKEKAKADTKA